MAIAYDYDHSTFRNDVAILRISQAVPISASVKTILMEDYLYNLRGQAMRVSGFGRTNTDNPTSQVLLFTDVRGTTTEDCQPYYTNIPITNTILCTRGITSWDTGICQGDR